MRPWILPAIWPSWQDRRIALILPCCVETRKIHSTLLFAGCPYLEAAISEMWRKESSREV